MTKRKLQKQAFELTKEILLVLLRMPLGLVDIFTDTRGYVASHYPKKQITLLKIRRAAEDLKKQRLIRMKKYREQIKYELTDLGKARALVWTYKKKTKTARTDGLATIVIFDIPEEKRKARNFLRRFLKENNFTQLQKSVFIGRFKLLAEFKQILHELDVEFNVSVLEGRVLHD